LRYFSHSSLSTFRSCPRRFYYGKIARIKTDDVPERIYTFLGSRFHEAMEFLYGAGMNGAFPTVETVLTCFDSRWNESWEDEIVLPAHNSSPEDWRAIGHSCIRQYFSRHHPFDQAVTLGLEKRIVFPVDDGEEITILGYIDRLAKTPDGVWQIHDYKTGASLPTQQQADSDQQLALYQIGVQKMWPTCERVELIWHYVRFDETVVSNRSSEQLDELRASTVATARDINLRGREEEAFEPVESGLCAYCDYQAVCPVRKHLHKVSSLPEKSFKNDTAVQLVDKWGMHQSKLDELKTQSDEVEREIDEIRVAILKLAESEGADVFAGSEYEVVIKRSRKLLFPRKSNPEEAKSAQQLESALRGSADWDAVSSLDAGRLKKLLQVDDETVTSELRKLLTSYVSLAEDVRVRLRHRQQGSRQ
jgi:putative RecB family exonuclease